MDASVPVVVLARSGHTGHGIARSLGRLGVPVYGARPDPRAPAARSRFWRETLAWNVLDRRPRESLDRLLRFGRRLGGRPILVSVDDSTLLFVADHAPALAEVFRFPAQPDGLARALSSKRGMYELCKRHGVPTPETVFPRSRAEVAAFAASADFPVVLKTIDNAERQRRGIRTRIVIAQDAPTLLARYDELEIPSAPNLMLQEFVPGPVDRIWVFHGYFDAAGRCLFGQTGRKLRQNPAYAGSTSLGVCRDNETVTRQALDFMAAVGYRGIVDIDYKYDARDGRYKLLDANPRVGANFRLFVDDAGLDVVRALYLDLTGQPVVPGRPREGRRWVSEVADVNAARRYRRDGRLGAREWIASYRGVEEGCWFARDDPVPFVAAVGQYLGRGMRGRVAWGRRRLIGIGIRLAGRRGRLRSGPGRS